MWDQYWDESIEGFTRPQRGTGVRRVAENVKIPSQWFLFLRDCRNKEEPFSFLTSQLSIQQFDQEIHMTLKQSDKSSPESYVDFSECNHEEAETRMVVHVLNAAQKHHQKIAIRTIDTDVVVIMLSQLPNILEQFPNVILYIVLVLVKH